MSAIRPLVIDFDTGTPAQLKAGDELDIPLEDRVTKLELQNKLLIEALIENGILIPNNLLT